ncbi:contractile injection system tape measure protein [Flavitalea sp. BT771]|uniref:contractile injection system tape measure protein n=1 Tax=Flavitalea sp. BT771 TaxID=3063329 RepID=UPI0026E157B8|nr:contractile injection system tape measure protein [Flavitalea sp. BT771]MDO6432089.1 contractile injection system tape measure protein [Flavitalea sp. BT771]MDV6220998.1 contractile injection system tape measure protein [Flavitalea sp. BT771]
MPTSYHIIQRQIFDIGFSREKEAYDLQNRFSRLFYNDATPVMTDVFDRLIPDGLVLRLDQLTLDLGRIRNDRLEKDFRERFTQALEKELERALNEYARREKPEWNQSLTDLLQYFLMTGTLPWWAAGDLLVNPAAVIDRLILDDPSGLKSLLIYTGQREYVRRRLVYQFPETTIRSVVETLEPDEAAFIFVYYTDLIHIQSTEQFFRREINEFEKDLWIFIFTYLLVDRGSNFNRKIFVKSTLGQMARQYNLEYGELIALLFRALESASMALVRRSSLSGIISTLFYEEEYAVEKGLPQSAASLMMEKMNVIRTYLLHGSLTGLATLYNESDLSEIFTGLMAEAPDPTYDMIRSMSEREGIWARIVHTFDEATVKSLVRLREPNESEFIFHYAKRLETLQRQKFLVKTDSSSFYQSVWELILSFLWTERGNVFNSRVFLEYNIRRISRRHQLSYRQLLAFLVQGIGQDIRSERDSSLFHSLAVLLKGCEEPLHPDPFRNSVLPLTADAPSDTGSFPKTSPPTSAVLPLHTASPNDYPSSPGEWLSALTHFLAHGRWPGKWMQAGHNEERLLQQTLHLLFRESPLTLMKLLMSEGAPPPVIQQAIRSLFASTGPARHLVLHIIRLAGEEPLRLLTAYMGSEILPAVEQILVSEIAPGPIYIHNAGLVLLHPLLPHFFARIGLTEKNQFIDQAARHRAVHLLQFLVDDGQEHPEQGLVLNKILCDIPLEETISLQITLTEMEKEVAGQLMEVLRQQWEKMKNSSAEALRLSFLQRDGALTPVQDGWRLQVEQKGIDVLLQYLPWSWKLIRLPWMNKILNTEWT